MGREIRRVPKDWVHPKNQPMYDKSYREAVKEWKDGYAKWESGEDPAKKNHPDCEYWDYYGPPPDPEYHRPDWTEESRTHYMMYSNTSEGSPISPPLESPEAVARWCVDNKASMFGGIEATYEQWLFVARGEWAPDMVIDVNAGTSAVGPAALGI